MAGFGLCDQQWLMSEAQSRWLRADEIWQILLNHHVFEILIRPPCSPCSGSVYFFDRRVTRYFRNDGHKWKKRRNGKTINEAHEKLKVGNIPMINCYYAWGEENPNFQRRCYSLLSPLKFPECGRDSMHIVFVHYLDAKKMTHKRSDLALPVPLSKPESCLEICTSNSIFEQKAQNSNTTFSESQHEQPSQTLVHLELGHLNSNSVIDAQMKGNLSDTFVETEPTSNGKKADAKSLLNSELECHEEVLSFEEPPQQCSPHLLDVNAPSFPGKENFDSGKLLALDKMAILDYEKTSGSLPDIFCGWDGYGLHGTESLYLMSEQNSDSLVQDSNTLARDATSNTLAFFEEDCFCPFPYAELQYVGLQDFQNLLDDFVLGLATRRAQRRRRWTKISGVFNLFSVRKLGFKVR